MSGERPAPPDPGPPADTADPAPAATPAAGAPAQIERTIAQFAERYSADLHTLREDVARRAPGAAAATEPPDAGAGPGTGEDTPPTPAARPRPGPPRARGRAGWRPRMLVLLLVLLVALALLLGLALRTRAGDRPASSHTATAGIAGGTTAVVPAVASATALGGAPTLTPIPAATATAPSTGTAGVTPAPASGAVAAAGQPASSPSSSPRASPTAGGEDAATVWRRVVATEAALRSGQFTATLTYPDGARATAQVAFDLGSGPRPPRLRLYSTYRSATGAHTTEYLVVGNTGWQRGPDGRWSPAPGHEGVWGQLQTYLPHTDAAIRPAIERRGDTAVLRWADDALAADTTLTVDPASGVPRELRRAMRGSGLVLTVAYTGWNTPVDITAPPGA